MPRTANSVRISISAPGWSSVRNAASEVRSEPVGAGSSPGGPTTTNLVTALVRSCTAAATTARPYRAAAKSPASAASSSPSATRRAASPLEASGTHSRPGRFAASHRRHCASACGWPPTVFTSPTAVPGLASSANSIGSVVSARISRSPAPVSSSTVAVTMPSTELSTGTTARSASPALTAARAAPTDGYGAGSTSAWCRESASLAVAASVNVPSGPR